VNAAPLLAVTLSVAMILTVRAASSLRPAKRRLKTTARQHRPVQTMTERFGSVVAEMNAFLLIFAIGLGTLDLVGVALVNPPALPAVSADKGQDATHAAADLTAASATAWRF